MQNNNDFEDLKKRMKQLERELDQPQSNYEKIILEPTQNPAPNSNSNPSSKIKTAKFRFSLPYKLLLWFGIGFGVFVALSLVVSSQTVYLFFASIYLIFASIFLFLSTLSLVAILLISILPALLFLFIAWKIYKWLA